MPLATGSRLGSYEILAPIGAGGMGEVYRARDAKLSRDVALKVLPDAFARDAERMSRFQREAKVLASLNHPNIATIHGLEDSGKTHALVMELVEGPTLADRIRTGPIAIDEALRIAKQMCDALEYAHERGIVHRDLKPANVKVTNDDAVKVLDFGLAKALEGDAASIDIANSPTMSRMATQAGVLLGTAAYMSPEQAKGKAVDRRADIWAFGCVLYEMLTGKMAFQGETVTDTLAAVIRAEPDWSQLPAATPIRVRVLLQRCLQKDPKQRLRDIGDARISLEEVLSGPAEGAPSVSAAVPMWRRVLPWAVAALVLVALAALAFVHFREKPATLAEPVHFQIPLLTNVGLTPVVELSPDGRFVAFAGIGSDGVSRLWLRPLASLEVRPLLGTEGIAVEPFFWSSDSRFVVFRSVKVAGTGGAGKLRRIAVSGGPAESLSDVTTGLAGGTSNRDGVIVFGQSPGGLMRIAAGGGPATPLTSATGGAESDVFPQFLPDGKHLIYTRFVGGRGEDAGVYVASLDAKPEEQTSKRLLKDISRAVFVPASDGGSGYLLFGRSGALVAQPFDAGRTEPSGEAVILAEGITSILGNFSVYFSSSDNGVLAYMSTGANSQLNQLTWYDRQGKVQGAVREPGVETAVNPSPDGKKAFVFDTNSQGTGGLWLLDFARGTKARFTFDLSGTAGDAVWSPDGNRIIFVSSRDGAFTSIYEKPASGATDEVLLLNSADEKHPRSWSRDGRFLFYDEFDAKTGKLRIRVLPLEGDKKPLPVQPVSFNEGSAQISPDGHWLAYASDETGRSELYVRAFSPDSAASGSAAGGKWLISNGGGTDARWRADGKELFYLTSDGKVMAVELSTSPVFQAGVPKVLFQGPPLLFPFEASMPSQWGVTPDGKRFLFAVPVTSNTRAPLTVVLNWQAALKK